MAKKRRISAKRIVSDIRGGRVNEYLMQHYGLSYHELALVFQKLIEAGLIGKKEIEARHNDSTDEATELRSTPAAQHEERSVPRARDSQSPDSSPVAAGPVQTPDKSRVPPDGQASEERTNPALLSQFAEDCLNPEEEQLSLWGRVVEALGLNKTSLVQSAIEESRSESEYIFRGFQPFCQVRDIRLLLKRDEKGGGTLEFVLLADGVPLDIFSLGKDPSDDRLPPPVLLMLIMYSYPLEYGGTILPNEQDALTALANCLKLEDETLVRIKATVYDGFISDALEDAELDSEETTFLEEIRQALKIARSTETESHILALYRLLEEHFDVGNFSANDAAGLKRLVSGLGLPSVEARDIYAAVVGGACEHMLEAGAVGPNEVDKFLDMIRWLGLDRRAVKASALMLLMSGYDDLICQTQITSEDIEHFTVLASRLGLDESDISDQLYELDLALFICDCKEGRIPVLPYEPVNLKKGELAHFDGSVTVIQRKTVTKTHRAYGGTRIKIGKTPVYLGGSTPVKTSHEEMVRLGRGRMVITNQRVIVVGTKITYSFSVNKIIDISVRSDTIQIMNEGRYGGRFYELSSATHVRKAAAVLMALMASD